MKRRITKRNEKLRRESSIQKETLKLDFLSGKVSEHKEEADENDAKQKESRERVVRN